MAWSILGITLLYLWWLYRQYLAWQAIPLREPLPEEEGLPAMTVLVALRDERAHLPALFASLQKQSYPHFKVILADDGSTDGSAALCRSLCARDARFQYLYVDNPQRQSPKKYALTQAIALVDTELIVTTDADCQMGPDWLAALAMYFRSHKVQMVCGPVSFLDDGKWFSYWQNLEFTSLIGTGAAGLQRGKPSMCNGANLAYRLTAFQQAGGYQGHAHLASGDDEFLMHQLHAQAPGSVVFAKSRAAIVHTHAQQSLRDLHQQRKRWASKWKHYTLSAPKKLAMGIFLFHLAWVLVPLFWFLEARPHSDVYLSAFVLRVFGNALFIGAVLDFFEKPFYSIKFVFLEFLYSAYVVFFGLLANFGGYEWKGTRHQG